jgi:hypothetical protein
MTLDNVHTYAKKFMEREYPDEAPYFDIAWEIFEEIVQGNRNVTLDLKGPIIRFEGEDTIMAPKVIRASYVVFNELGDKIESSDDTTLRPLMIEALFQNKFSHEFSQKIVEFILEHRNH